MTILDKIVEEKKREIAKLPARLIAAGDLRDAMLEHGERRDFLAALKNPRRRSAAVSAASSRGVSPRFYRRDELPRVPISKPRSNSTGGCSPV